MENRSFTVLRRMACASAFSICLALCACGGKKEPSLTDYVGMEAAKDAALKALGVPADQAAFSLAELTDKNGVPCYRIVFTQADGDGTEHIYEIDAATGIVLTEMHSAKPQAQETPVQTAEASALPAESMETSAELPDEAKPRTASQTTPKTVPQSAPQTAPSGEITAQNALAIALSHAGLTDQDISFSNVKADTEDGQPIFEVEFALPDMTEYDYEIRVSDGAVLSFDYDVKSAPRQGSLDRTAVISESQARQAVMGKLPQVKETDISLYLEEDDGKLEYEGWVVDGAVKYEFKIDAYDGSILEWEGEKIR